METLCHSLCPGHAIRVPKGGFSFGSDALLLSAFARPKAGDLAADLGTGCGILPLLFCLHKSFEHIYGIELSESVAALARENVRENGFSRRVTILCRDLRDPIPLRDLDLVLANPPYIRADAGPVNGNREKSVARHEVAGGLGDFCRCGARLLKNGGEMDLVYCPQRLGELILTLKETGLAPKELLFVHARPGKEASLVLVRAKKGAGEGLKVLPPFYFETETGEKTREQLLLLEEGRMER